jgi:hypothetical protein
VEGDDEVILSAGARHVEETDPLVEAHLFVDGLPIRERLRLDVLAELVADRAVGRKHHLGRRRARPRLGGKPRDNGDGELQALGRVDRHDAYGIIVGLG